MMQKPLLLAAAVVLLLVSNLRLVFIEPGGTAEDGYTPGQIVRAEYVASAVLDELTDSAAENTPQFLPRLSLIRPQGSTKAAVHSVLSARSDISCGSSVYVNGTYLGHVSDRNALERSIRRYIAISLPSGSTSGTLDGSIEFADSYGRRDRDIDYDSMVQMIKGIAPVRYSR